jgi:protein associated with RNAse G/E
LTETITIHKLDATGREVWAYPTRLLARGQGWILVEGDFDRDDVVFRDWSVRRGDRMVEIFYADRPYNVFAVHDGSAGGLKGWYCNITRPARLSPADVYFEDLALDLVVFPDGRSLVLDEDEFAGLALSTEERARARQALDELLELSRRREGPFAGSPSESAPA